MALKNLIHSWCPSYFMLRKYSMRKASKRTKNAKKIPLCSRKFVSYRSFQKWGAITSIHTNGFRRNAINCKHKM